jgi:hypothetical protein
VSERFPQPSLTTKTKWRWTLPSKLQSLLETKIPWGAQRRSIADKRGMVEATWLGPIRARVAWAHGVNANQLFGWLRLYLNAATPVIELTPVLL